MTNLLRLRRWWRGPGLPLRRPGVALAVTAAAFVAVLPAAAAPLLWNLPLSVGPRNLPLSVSRAPRSPAGRVPGRPPHHEARGHGRTM